jgi:sigma-B regulation protein RsbU (phosphoserine phosphatase)
MLREAVDVSRVGVRQGRRQLAARHVSSTHYSQDSVALRAGDRLALYSDGLVEAESKTGEVFGARRLSAVLESCGEYDLSYARDCTIHALELHSSGAPRADDQTLMLIEVG